MVLNIVLTVLLFGVAAACVFVGNGMIGLAFGFVGLLQLVRTVAMGVGRASSKTPDEEGEQGQAEPVGHQRTQDGRNDPKPEK